MMEFKKAGKTIVFCSHSMYLINELCAASTIWLCDGRVCSYGKTAGVISQYMAYLKGGDGKEDTQIDPGPQEKPSLPEIIIENIRLVDDKGKQVECVKQFQTVVLQIRTTRTGPPLKGHLAMGLDQLDGQTVFGTTTKISGHKPVEFAGEQTTEFVIPSIPFLAGTYRAVVFVGDEHALRPIDKLSSAPFMIESKHPEFGMFWVDHFWRFDDEKCPVS
jgi:hypothetical protein